ncbi:MAG: VOC family protein [Dehalococcoidia bacterium]|nr:VOC family protein [Dehalococcoidia bacterium]
MRLRVVLPRIGSSKGHVVSTTPAANRFSHAGFVVRDIRRMTDFYREGFGLRELHSSWDRPGQDASRTLNAERVVMHIVWLGFGDPDSPALELIQFVEPTGPDQHQVRNASGQAHVGFLVPDIAGTLARLETLGAIVTGPPRGLPDGRQYAYFRDPEGNWLEL